MAEQDDYDLCVDACLAAICSDETIGDGVARTIGALFHDGGTSQSAQFMSTGVIHDPDSLASELFRGCTDVEPVLVRAIERYLTEAGERGKVDGWSDCWVD